MESKHHKIEHGFSIANIAIIIVLILIFWGIHWGAKIAPQVRETADQVVSLNDLKNFDIKGKIGGCVPIIINGTI